MPVTMLIKIYDKMDKAAGGDGMRTIGITGGVGGGKSQILAYLKGHYNCEVILADEVAHRIKEPGERFYVPLIELLGEEILAADKKIDKGKMAEKIFRDKALLEQVNRLMHPMVKEYILEEKERLEKESHIDVLFIEAALLIEDGYGDVVDELWYIYASEEDRLHRLKTSREYSEEKIKAIFRQQLSEEEFRKHCRVVIDNSGSLEDAYGQISNYMKRVLGELL